MIIKSLFESFMIKKSLKIIINKDIEHNTAILNKNTQICWLTSFILNLAFLLK